MRRSPNSGDIWPIEMQLGAGDLGNHHIRKFPGHLSAVVLLSPVDARLLEFNVQAQPEFQTFCSFLPRELESVRKTQPTEMWGLRQPSSSASSSTFPAKTLRGLPVSQSRSENGVRRCNWLPGSDSRWDPPHRERSTDDGGAEVADSRRWVQQQQGSIPFGAPPRPAYALISPCSSLGRKALRLCWSTTWCTTCNLEWSVTWFTWRRGSGDLQCTHSLR